MRHDSGQMAQCATDEVGEICVANPGVIPGSIYTESDKNRELFHAGGATCAPATSAGSTRTAISGSPGGPRTSSSAAATTSTRRDRGGAGRAPGRGDGRRHRPARRPCGRGALRLCRAGGGRDRDRRGAAEFARGRIPERAAHAQARRGPARAAQDRGGQGLQARPAQARDQARLRRGAGRCRARRRVAEVVEDRRRGLVARIGGATATTRWRGCSAALPCPGTGRTDASRSRAA